MTVEAANGVAAAGDEVARLYDQYGAKLQRFCVSRLRSHEEAEDAVQSTFLRAYTALRKGAVPQYEAAWLYKIAHNVCLSRIESTGRRARVESPQDLDLLGAEMAAPSSRRDELIGLESALADMPANMRQAILLREWQGLSYQEIAEALGVSVSAVESLIFRGRRYLANALEPAKRAAGAINVGWLVQPVRALLASGRSVVAGAGAGAKVAAGVALLAAGGGGVGVGLSVGSTHAPKPPAATVPAAATAGSSSGASSAAAPAGATTAAIVARTHATTSTGRRAAREATRRGGAPVAATPGTPRTPTGTPTTPITPITPTAPTADTGPHSPPKAKPPVTTATVPVRTPTLPPLPTTATVTVPGVTTVTTPTLPPVTTPTLPTPTVTVPGVTTVTVPTVTLP
jgi:RNA polymerase sigma factor (sigma-70 family)